MLKQEFSRDEINDIFDQLLHNNLIECENRCADVIEYDKINNSITKLLIERNILKKVKSTFLNKLLGG